MGIFRQVFGSNKDEIWSELSREIGAEFEEGGMFKNGKVVLSYRYWEITLDTYTVHTGSSHITYTRMRAPYVNMDKFRFKIYQKNIFSSIGKAFGMQDIEVGDIIFDDKFIIKGEPEHLVGALLANGMIRQLIQEQKGIRFQIKDSEGVLKKYFPEDVDELHFEVVGVIKDKERLKKMFDLFKLVLDGLCHIGMASETMPNVKLE